MNTHQHIADVELSVSDINRLQRWYRAAVANDRANLDAGDLVLDARLRTIRTDLEDRVVVRGAAIRHRSDLVRFQHPGVERRARGLVSVPRTPQRIVRPVTVTTH